MNEWCSLVQTIVGEVDKYIKNRNEEILTLSALSQKLGYSEFHISRKFREISGMHPVTKRFPVLLKKPTA